MPDLAPYHSLIVFAHVLGVFAFLLAHGVSAGVMFRIRRERDPVALRALLKLSEAALLSMSVGALVFFVTGILAGFSGNYWTSGTLWIWISLVLIIVVGGLMTPLARFPLDRVREAIGDRPPKGSTAVLPPDAAAIEAAAGAVQPVLVASLGLGTVVILTWLMMFKPF